MESISLVLPDQLFAENACIQKGRKIFLLEEFLYFKQFTFHKKKIIFLHACILSYKNYLITKGYDVEIIEAHQENAELRKFVTYLSTLGVKSIHISSMTDDWISRRMKTVTTELNIKIQLYTSPAFMNSIDEGRDFFKDKKKYHQTDFYIWQRKKRQILIDSNSKPIGGKWTYDAENRSKLPKNLQLPTQPNINQNPLVRESIAFAEKYFPDNYGSADKFFYPINFKEAEEWFDHFLVFKFEKFGIYEDAFEMNDGILFHSVLSPLLNVGLITPAYIIQRSLQFAETHNIPLNSLEGFIRQILGWREFIRIVYEMEGRKQRTTNYWGFKRKIPSSFWTGTTGILPVDNVIQKALATGYNHHIERLMVMGNFMLLCEFDPSEVYIWFMEMYVDAYDWVMVPNVYGMTQFADGGLMTTKPYISGSNYLMKMGNWEKGSWQHIWDGLFWRFMDVHRNFFLEQPRLGMLVHTLDKMETSKRKQHYKNAENFLHTINT